MGFVTLHATIVVIFRQKIILWLEAQSVNIFWCSTKFLSKYFGTNENFIYLPPQKVNKAEMKADIHPKNYRMVVFKDMSNDYSFITRSTVDTKETVKWEDGNEYPLFKLEISHKSHPFFTGTNMLIDTAGRIDKFNKRYAKKK